MMKQKSKYIVAGIIVVLVIIGIILVSVFLFPECKINDDCLAKTCFTVQCTNNKCVYSPITDCCGNDICEVGETYPECVADCPNCDDDDKCTEDSYDYHKQECVNKPILDKVCCGNDLCEIGETYESCTRDCPNCDDKDKCTEDSYDYHKQECINEIIIPCCGNEICDEDVETFSNCATDCPDCDDDNKITEDSFNYTTQKCENITYYLIDDFDEGSASWSLDPRWSIVFPEDETNGMLTYDVHAGYAYTSFGDQSWTDYTFSFKIKLEEEAIAHAYVRRTEWAYALSINEDQLILWKDAKSAVDLEVKGYPFGSNQSHDIKIEVKGNSIKIYVNDNLEISYTDGDNPLLAGGVGLEAVSKKVYFDDVKVKGHQ